MWDFCFVLFLVWCRACFFCVVVGFLMWVLGVVVFGFRFVWDFFAVFFGGVSLLFFLNSSDLSLAV